MFASINAHSPPLSYFPASQRVTYLYYLGRYLFANNLFFPAMTALQSAYDQCHKQALNQRGLILAYLISCNIILGRFPSNSLLQRPEARGLADAFLPLCQIIRRGDLSSFKSYLAVDSPHADWFAQKGILLQLRNRCEILVWRSLARKVFILSGFHGDQTLQAQRGPPPFLYLYKLEAAVQWMESQGLHQESAPAPKSNKQRSLLYSFPSDRDLSRDERDNLRGSEAEYEDFLNPEGYFDISGQWVDVTGPDKLPNDKTTDNDDIDPFVYLDTIKTYDEGAGDTPFMEEVESVLASLLTQDLMRGYLTHRNPRFAIPNARQKGALPTGFPNVWQTIYARESEDNHVPGWVKPSQKSLGDETPARTPGPLAAAMGGRVVNLSGARPVGVQ